MGKSNAKDVDMNKKRVIDPDRECGVSQRDLICLKLGQKANHAGDEDQNAQMARRCNMQD